MSEQNQERARSLRQGGCLLIIIGPIFAVILAVQNFVSNLSMCCGPSDSDSALITILAVLFGFGGVIGGFAIRTKGTRLIVGDRPQRRIMPPAEAKSPEKFGDGQ